MNSLIMRPSPRTRLTLQVAAVIGMVFVMFCISVSTAFADPIDTVTNGGTAPAPVVTAAQNAGATALLIGVVIAIFGMVVMGAGLMFSGGSSKIAKAGFWISTGLLVVFGSIGTWAQLTQGIFNGILGTAPVAPPKS